MNIISQWREFYCKEDFEIKDSFSEFKQSYKIVKSLCFSLAFQPFADKKVGGIFIDIGYNPNNQKIACIGATFSKSFTGLYVSSSHIDFEYNHDDSKIQLKGAENKLSESVEGFIQYEIKENKFTLIDFQIDLLYHNHSEQAYLPIKRWALADYLADDFAMLCPYCLGQGFYQTMEIPQKDWDACVKSGNTGYALYSCNRINATFACQHCGGQGEEYAEWYIEEKPTLKDEATELVIGSGWASEKIDKTLEITL